jgi:hypothetical protein
MVKNVVKPARISVVNLAPLISLGCDSQLPTLLLDRSTYMTGSLKVEVPAHNGAGHYVIQPGLVRCKTHDCKYKVATKLKTTECFKQKMYTSLRR